MGKAAGVCYMDRHREIAEDEMEEPPAEFSAVLRESKEAHEQKYDQAYITDLEGKLDSLLEAALKIMGEQF